MDEKANTTGGQIMTIKVILAGPRGRMGKEALNMITNRQDFSLVACIDRKIQPETLNEIHHLTEEQTAVYDNAEQCFNDVKADVLVDLTVPETGYQHTKLALENHLHAVVGTTGFSDEQIDRLSTIAKGQQRGCIIAPNFALGAVLMMQFAKTAAKYFPDVEIIEKHHDQKIDAPSGTAQKTIDLISETRTSKEQGHPEEYETIQGSRGGNIDGVHVHSVRLPGLVAHQEVIFGGKSELLTIKHDSFHREAFMHGLRIAIEKVMDKQELVYGLEHVLDL